MVVDTASGPRTGRPDRLLQLALSRPSEAYADAIRVLAAGPGPFMASIAYQARGIVLRDYGNQADALGELRRALRAAHRSGSSERVADVEATLGATLGMAGRAAEGLAAIDRALRASRGVLAGRVLMRRAAVLRILGRYREALADLRRAVAVLHRGGDRVWEARSRSHRFLVYSALGQAARADRDLVIAERLFAAAGQDLESAMAVHNRADVAFQAGDLPAALGFLDEAAARYAALRAFRPALAADRCAVLLAAGLATEAVTAVEQALRAHLGRGGDAARTAELMFASATAAQAAGRPELAQTRAEAAGDLFRRQGRAWWQARAAFVALQSRLAAGTDAGRTAAGTEAGRTAAGTDAGQAPDAAGQAPDAAGDLADQAGCLADRLDALHAPEAPAAHLLAGQLAAGRGRAGEADRHLARAARYRHRGPPFGHAAGWLAHALRAEARGSARAALTACRCGLRAAGEHQRALAAPELRAHAAGYGTALAAVAQRHAIRRRDARALLGWSERWRASALASPAVRLPDDPELAADLTALRGVSRLLDAARSAGTPADALHREQRRLEAAIRSRTRRVHGSRQSPGGPDPGDVSALLDGLDGHRLVEITAVDGRLYVTTAAGRRVRTRPAGTLAEATREVELARFMLRRLAYGRPSPGALDDLATAGLRLQRVLLGGAAGELRDGPVVVVPPARLHAVPWGMLPVLRAAAVTVAPSAGTWLRAGRSPAPHRRRTVLVAGPGLPGAAAEIGWIVNGYPGAEVLCDGAATADATLRALDGAWTAHVTAHGVFRAGNPMFSALMLDDGPLTVYDLCRLRRAPRRLVLSSCDSAVAAPVGADELLGMVTALVPLGTASLLASVVPVNDAAAAPLMVEFHGRLRAGDPFGAALRAVRAAAGRGADPVAVATALSFVPLGR